MCWGAGPGDRSKGIASSDALSFCGRPRMRVDLNADAGESFGAWALGDDAALFSHVTSVNVACGFHAGDPSVIRRTIRLAAGRGVRIGAHPGYPDLQGFGRRAMALTSGEVEDLVLYQVAALLGIRRGRRRPPRARETARRALQPGGHGPRARVRDRAGGRVPRPPPRARGPRRLCADPGCRRRGTAHAPPRRSRIARTFPTAPWRHGTWQAPSFMMWISSPAVRFASSGTAECPVSTRIGMFRSVPTRSAFTGTRRVRRSLPGPCAPRSRGPGSEWRHLGRELARLR